jgi:NADPH-dependent 7-cyano-7-deazaguanine reductase QueF
MFKMSFRVCLHSHEDCIKKLLDRFKQMMEDTEITIQILLNTQDFCSARLPTQGTHPHRSLRQRKQGKY